MSAQLTPLASRNNHPQIVPNEEEDILNFLLEVRAELAKLKQNRTQFLNAKQVQITYQSVLTKVRELDEIRKNSLTTPAKTATTLIHDSQLHNRVDSVLDDVFQLLSLCFLTVGMKNSAPATYSSLSTVQCLLEHLNESRMFTMHDLRPIKERLDEIQEIVEKSSYRNDEFNDSALVGLSKQEHELIEIENERTRNRIEEDLLVRAKLQFCIEQFNQMESRLEKINPNLSSIVDKLYHIRRGLLSLASPTNDTLSKSDNNHIASTNHNVSDKSHKELVLLKMKKQLVEIESQRDENGYYKSLETNKVEMEGQGIVNKLVDDCNDLINDLSHTQNGNIITDPYLQQIYKNLIDIKTNLANLMVTRRWTLRETDLFSYQKKLAEIDSLRVNGKFKSATSDAKGQSIILYLLRRCYAIIYKLLESSEPISESLQSIHTQLSTVRRCLMTLKRLGGVTDIKELYPYQMKLASLDELRIDGKFYDANGDIPEGQGILNAMLAECFDMVHELKCDAEAYSSSENATPINTDKEDSSLNLKSLNINDKLDGSLNSDDEGKNGLSNRPQQFARDLGVHSMNSDEEEDNDLNDEDM
ncbi:hypothetical protein TBLA_0A00930 [Henningerozyma blattae CBS 6284]|uniref:Uncharacterized protein n=1 Tax=Henningerozyma blattae (strain ATCC 34711 / CBS 6284 / DSM 70876 / NBRC 10599 / NRRL Y-10934 / UCD 77-7) TaxID=1071380 RepID=I2GUU1_HENB6|nr:hypothetical protein TBLA_0A00930 [Tetrapisispora blattae CBS 6284]CCH57893.1 hypothetical protein TBLA_0A00930 [Tetrapisispora blattae CBS 6284]